MTEAMRMGIRDDGRKDAKSEDERMLGGKRNKGQMY